MTRFRKIQGEDIEQSGINTSELNNDAGFLAGYSETDTLDSVTSRGAVTTNGIGVGRLDVTAGVAQLNITSTNFNVSTNFNCPVGDRALFSFKKGGKNRWLLENSGGAETGGNVAADMLINRYADSGAYLGTPWRLKRNTGFMGVNTNPQAQLDVGGDAIIDDDLTVAGDTFHVDSTNGRVGVNTTSPDKDFTVVGTIKATDINFTGLPTSDTGLSTGDVWNDNGTLKIV